VKLLIPALKRLEILDVPNSRSSHDIPTPRGGGLGLFLGIAVGISAYWMLSGSVSNLPVWAGACAFALLGLTDDLRGGLPVWLRIVLQAIITSTVLMLSGPFDRLPLPPPLNILIGGWWFPIGLLWVVGVTNIFNFLDGIDGFAAVQAIVAGVGLFLVAKGDNLLISSLVITAATMGFLPHNWHKAKTFMGDVGSCGLGSLLALAPWLAPTGERSTLIFALGMFLWFFLADGTFTIARRLVKGEKIWQPHRTHLYQRLVRSGMSHSQVTMLVGAGATILTGITVFVLNVQRPLFEWVPFATAVLLFAAYLAFTTRTEKQGFS